MYIFEEYLQILEKAIYRKHLHFVTRLSLFVYFYEMGFM